MEKKASAKKTKKTPAKKLPEKHKKKDFLVVGLGASAGGVKALQEFFATIPPNTGMAFVAILHLSPEHESSLPHILQAQTAMKVMQVTETVEVEPNNVYVIPPNVQLEMVDGVIRPAKAERPTGHRIAIDVFFRTLAEAYERNAVCVVMSGTGSDGTLGLKRVKESNGFAIVQDPEDAEYDSMPRSAINTQLADWVLPVHKMPEKLIHFKESSERLHLTNGADAKKIADEIHADESLREILTLLRVRTGHDFSNYKTPTLVRRIARHLQIHELEDIPSYLELLRNHPNELQSLLKNLLINVTNFFRDSEAFEAVESEIVPNLFAGKTGKDTVRIWSAGCASGEEAFSLAMLLTEYADRLADPPKIQVFASDVDDEAIAEAREHRYPESIEADVSPERLKRFFTKEGSFYRVKKELREMVLFAPHNVLRDPPFSRLDMISCRNLLIYLNRDTQERVLQIFHFALNSHGYLFLGSSETAENSATMFSPINKKQRTYSRRSAPVSQTSLPMMPVVGRWEVRVPERKNEAVRDRATTLGEIHYKLLENYALSSVLVNHDFDIVYLSGTANKFLRFAGGEPSRNLLKAVVPDLLPDLRAALFTAQREHKSSEFPNIRVRIDGEETTINLIVRAVDVKDEASDFLLVIFEERNSQAVQKEANREIKKIADKDEAMETVVRRLEEDLQRTKEHLRSTIEQHETTVEELKASNEELQAINEELRSASEELETSKEELQSVNEELTTVNHELKDKIDETSRINSDLSNLMAATDIATIFLDKQLKIKRYTPPVEQIFNITPLDVGRPLEHFTHHLRYKNLSADAEKALRSLTTIEHEISDDKDRSYLSRFAPYRTIDDRIDGVVLNFIDITDRKIAEQSVRVSEERLQKAINIETVGVIFFDNELEITDCNEAFVKMSGYTRRELQSDRFSWEMFTPDGFAEVSNRAIAEMNATGIATPYEKEYVRKDGSRFWALFAAKRIGKNEIVEFVTDITEQKRTEAALRESEVRRNLALDAAEVGTFLYHPLEDRGEPDARMLELFGLHEGDTLNLAEALDKMLHPEMRDYYAAAVVEAIDPQGDGKLDAEIRVVHPDESTHWIAITAQTVFEGKPPKPVRMYGTAADITERKQAEEVMRESEATQSFLLKLADRLRPLSDAVEIVETVTRDAMDYFKTDRSYYCEVEGDTVIIRRDAHRNGSPSVANVYSLSETPLFKAALKSGQPVAVANVKTSDKIDDSLKEICLSLGIAAYINVPIFKNKRLVGMFCLTQAEIRNWTGAELELAKETAERTWAAVERARAEESLNRSEEHYRAIVNQNVAGIFEFDLSGRIIFANDEFCRMLGYECGTLSELPMEDFIHAEDLPDSVKKLERMQKNKKPFETEKRYVRKDGSVIWVHNSISPITNGDKKIHSAVIISIDITERKRAEIRLREAEERTRITLEAAELATWEWDVASGEVFWNEQHFRLFGMKPRKRPVTNEDFFRHVHPDFREYVAAELKKSVEEKIPFDVEFCAVLNGGKTRWMSGYGRVTETNNKGETTRMSGVMFDITERKTATEILRKSEEQLQLIIESTKDYSIVTFDLKGKITRWNTGAERIFGWTEAEMIGRTGEILFTPEDRGKKIPEQEFKTALAKGRAEDERWHVRKDGSRFFASGVMQPLRDGTLEGYVKIARDQTEKLRAETALREQEMLRQFVRTQEDERQRIARDIHDQLGQQLTALRFKIHNLKKLCMEMDIPGKEKAAAQVEDLQKTSEQLDRDVDFLAWELRPSSLEDLGLRLTLQNFVKEWSGYTGVQAEFHTSGIGKIHLTDEIETNLYRIAQESLNNINKHAKATSVSVLLEKRKETIVLIIEDNGVGFDPAKKRKGARGLGLVGMRERARILGGETEIESEKGKGTTIYVRVPVKTLNSRK